MRSIIKNYATVDECRDYANKIAEDIQSIIDQHSTESVERTTLRFMELDGVSSDGVPLVNTLVEKARKKGVLSKGIVHLIGAYYQLEEVESIQEAIDEIIYDSEVDWKLLYKTELTTSTKEELTIFFQNRYKKLEQVKANKLEKKNRLKVGKEPLKYLIVATGNIYEDVAQAEAAAETGADIIAVIRSTAQSLLDYVPYGATTEGYGGTYATQQNFKIMREALDKVGERLGRYIHLVNYSSGLCMAEIAYMAAREGLDYLLNDAMYGILFRDINMKRTFIDQYISRRICSHFEISINTGEDNYLTTSDAFDFGYTVLTSQFINEAFATLAGLRKNQMGLGHAYEINPSIPQSFLYEFAQAKLIREVFPEAPLKYMPPTKHMTGDIFYSHLIDALFNIASKITNQSIHLLGIPTEALHTPLLHDRFLALKNVDYMFNAFEGFENEFDVVEGGLIEKRANQILDDAHQFLKDIADRGLMSVIGEGKFANIKRFPDGGKGLDGVFQKNSDYFNPMISLLEK
ncbi:D-lysine 5,6-aminomutase subunit alpha [bacterium]|nr:D-lysine 5,6-aminomutase subunit alpha [bacterium]